MQANLVQGAQRTLICAGQFSADADGNLLHGGEVRAQLGQALDNLETVLKQAGFSLADVMRLNYYTTDVDAFIGAAEVSGSRLA
ncbi:MAG: RidA family protein, partial [Dehalococcoidia bacterium]